VHDASRWVRQTAGEAAKDIADADRPPQDVTTDSWEALRLMAAAVKERQSDHQQEAAALLTEAVREDSQFALGYMMLGDTYDSLGRYTNSYDAYRKALITLGARRLDKREELRIRGLAAWEVEDYKASEVAFSTYTALYPTDEVGWFYRAHPTMMLGNPEQAITLLREAARLGPSTSRVFGHLTKDNLIVGKFDEVEQNIARLRALGNNDDAALYEGQLSFLTGRYQTAETLLLGLQQSKDPEVRSISYSVLSCLLAELGRYNQAIETLQRGIREDSSTGNVGARADRLLALASLYARRRDKAASRKAALEALQLDPSLPHALTAGTILARSGFLDDAKNTLSAVASQNYPPISEIVQDRLEGEIALAAGQKQKALAEFEKADAVEAPVHARDYLARARLACDKPKEALALYARIVGSPGQIWFEPQAYEPGFLADMLFQYGELAARLGEADASDALTRYLKMREHGDKGLIEDEEAEVLLERNRAGPHFSNGTTAPRTQ
jgi:tetratricopeptide (TPR) repeat protein